MTMLTWTLHSEELWLQEHGCGGGHKGHRLTLQLKEEVAAEGDPRAESEGAGERRWVLRTKRGVALKVPPPLPHCCPVTS